MRMDRLTETDRPVSRAAILLVYGLYLARFFTGISMLFGVIAAAFLRGSSRGASRQQLDWFIRIFWYDVAVWIGCALLVVACFFIEPPGSSGPGQLLFLGPIGIVVVWNVWLFIALVRRLLRFLDGYDANEQI